jgi:hypothetical protein
MDMGDYGQMNMNNMNNMGMGMSPHMYGGSSPGPSHQQPGQPGQPGAGASGGQYYYG